MSTKRSPVLLIVAACLMSLSSTAQSEVVLKYQGTGIPASMLPSSPSSSFRTPISESQFIGDINGGTPEMVLVGCPNPPNTDGFSIVNIETGTLFSSATPLGIQQVLFADMDDDGCLDIIIGATNMGCTGVYVYGWEPGCAVDTEGGTNGSDGQLQQNAPNPFNPSTNIAFSLQESGNVIVRMMDISGRTIRTLIDGAYEIGDHEIQWSGLDELGHPVASGTYYYELRVDGRQLGKKKAVVLK